MSSAKWTSVTNEASSEQAKDGGSVVVETACTACRGAVEPELSAVYPASDVCLECMPVSERQRLEKELNQVQRLDRSLLPSLAPVPGWDVGLYYRPSRLLSGDFYDVEERDGELTLMLGDVMGKGIPAALLRTALQSTITALAPEISSPGRLLERANAHFLRSASPGRLASLFYGRIDGARGRLRYANAGHLPPLLRTAGGEWCSLAATGMVLGAVPGAPYREGQASLSVGDSLILFSDGFTDEENERGELFDERAITSRVESDPDAPAQVLASSLASELDAFAAGEPSDDRTLLVVRRT